MHADSGDVAGTRAIPGQCRCRALRFPHVVVTLLSFVHRLWSDLHRLSPEVSTLASAKEHDVHCPFCRHGDSRVVDSRATEDGTAIRRRRQCPECSRRFTTVETASLTVVKRSGVAEPFSR